MLRSIESVLVIFLLSTYLANASPPVFIQAIQSALGSMPFSGFPMTAGLTGAKLAVGGKLLYFLGLFGRQSPQSTKTSINTNIGEMPQFPGGFLGSSGFPGTPMGFPGFGQPIPPKQGFAMGNIPVQQGFSAQSKPPVNPAVLMSALANQGINPLQLLQALESAGLDPTQVMESLTSSSGNTDAGLSSIPFGGPGKRAGQGRPTFSSQNNPTQTGLMNEMPHDLSDSLPPDSENLRSPSEGNEDSGNDEDVESFFSFMKEMDDNKCISRLICDIGADPEFLGEFSRNIDTIINSLDVSSESGAYDYVQIMNAGRNGENCVAKFTECDNEAYDIVKSVAPSVGVPSGINSESINKL